MKRPEMSLRDAELAGDFASGKCDAVPFGRVHFGAHSDYLNTASCRGQEQWRFILGFVLSRLVWCRKSFVSKVLQRFCGCGELFLHLIFRYIESGFLMMWAVKIDFTQNATIDAPICRKQLSNFCDMKAVHA